MLDAVVIGMGGIAYGYDEGFEAGRITHIDALDNNPNYRILGAVESDSIKRDYLSSIVSFPIFDECDIKKLENADVVAICTPTEIHLESMRLALSLNPSHIILEKPISNSLSNSNEIMELVTGRNVSVHVNLFRLYDKKLSDLFSSLTYFEMEAWCSKGLLHNGIHFLSLYLNYVNDEVSIVSKNNNQIELKSKNTKFTLKDIGNDIDDNGFILRSNKKCFYYIDGGRLVYKNSNNQKQYFGSFIKDYMDYIYNSLLSDSDKVIPSFELALKCQNLLEQH